MGTVVRFLLSAPWRNKGYGTQSLRWLVSYAFQTLHVNKVTLSVFSQNTAALRCYEKTGFRIVSENTRDNGWLSIQMEKRAQA